MLFKPAFQKIDRHMKQMTLKKQVLLMITFFLISILLIQVIYTYRYYVDLKAKSAVSTTNLLAQVGKNIDTFSDNLLQVSTAVGNNSHVDQYLSSDDPVQREELRSILSDFFSYSVYSNSYILDVAVIDNQGRIYGKQSMPNYSIWDAVQKEYEAKHLDSTEDSIFDLVETQSGSSYYVLTTPVYFNGIMSLKIGHCMITSNGKGLQEILNKMVMTDHTSVYLVNEENKILACSDYSLTGSYLDSPLASLCQSGESAFSADYRGRSYSIQQLALSESHWKLISMIPTVEIMRPILPFLWFGVILSGISILVLLYISSLFFRNITSSIGSLSSQMKEIGKHSLHGRIRIDRNNEIGEISVGINAMLDQIDTLNHNIFQTQTSLYEMEILKKEAELRALQNQINPHFLYNTLECIRDIAIVYHADEISSIAVSMTKIFRYCIKAETIVTIRQETECIDEYINIVQIRYQNRFRIVKEVDPAILSLKMMKFILQPVIENAIFHGLELKSGPGTLWIRGRVLEDGTLFFEIADDGVGMDEATLSRMRSSLESSQYSDSARHTGIGLLNIHSRIKKMYGEQYGLSVASTLGKGTCVSIHFPQYTGNSAPAPTPAEYEKNSTPAEKSD